jgi:pimeloyl-ACP methyl ester carboxylesterase
VLWGELDPWLRPELGETYARRLPQSRHTRIAGRHWPWLDDPAVIDHVAAFLG